METNPNKYIISYEELTDLIDNAHGNKNKIALAQEYTPNIQQLIKTLNDLYPLLDDSNMKNRFTRLKNKISLTPTSTHTSISQDDDDQLEY